jgi:hypothetical protein
VTTPEKPGKPVSMKKASGNHEPTPATRPRVVLAAVIAMAISGVAAFGASIALYGQRAWVTSEQLKANSTAVSRAVASAVAAASSSSADPASASSSASASATKHWPVEHNSTLHDQVSRQQSAALIGTIVVMVALALLASSVYRGKHWSRWAVVGFWFLASISGTMVGFGRALSVGTSAPAVFKVPAFFAGLALIVAVVLVNLPASTQYFALSRPDRGDGAPARRGMFTPRTPPARAGRASAGRSKPTSPLTSSAIDRGEAYIEKRHSKRRAATNAEAVAKGAQLARNRAKASKSRRTPDS